MRIIGRKRPTYEPIEYMGFEVSPFHTIMGVI